MVWLMYLLNQKPFEESRQLKVEVANESVFLLLTYSLVLFSDLNKAPAEKNMAGWVMFGVICLAIFANFASSF